MAYRSGLERRGSRCVRTSGANNPAGDCAPGFSTLVMSGANLDADGTCGASITADPMLDALGFNPPMVTQTHRLLSGSPALDAAASCPPPATDQRGVERPMGRGCDLGAFESRLAPAQAVELEATMQTVAWTGPTAPAADALAPIIDSVDAVFAWDAEAESFLSYSPSVPAGNRAKKR